MRKDFAKEPAGKVPHVACPHPLYGVALCKLREDGVYPVAKAAQEGASFGSGITLFGRMWGQKLHAHIRQVLFGLWRVVVAVPNDQPRAKLSNLWEHGELVSVGWSHRKTSYEPRPAHPHMHPKAVEGLLEEDILAESGFSFEAMAAVGASKAASRHRHRVADGESRVVRSEGEDLLPEALLDLPEVGSLPSESGAMHSAEGGEPFVVVSSEEEVDAFVGVYAEELADHFDGKYLRVGKPWSGTALANAATLDAVVDEAEDRDDEGAKIHKKKTSVTLGAIGLTPSVGRSSLWLKPSKKLAHRVS